MCVSLTRDETHYTQHTELKYSHIIYKQTLKSIELDKIRTIAIGDSLFHDIKGANNFSIDSVLVKSGIHNDINTINKISQNHQIKPKFLIDNFSL